MRQPTVHDLSAGLRQVILDALPDVRGHEKETLVRLLRPRDGFFHKAAALRSPSKSVVAFGTVTWEMATPSGGVRLEPFEPVLLEARPSRRGLLKLALGTAAAALVGVPLLARGGFVRAEGLVERFALARTHADRAEILNNVYGMRTEEARMLYVRILITPWPTAEVRLVQDALAGLEIGGDQYLYTLACYYVLYARPEIEMKRQAILRLSMLKDSLIRENLPLLKQHDLALYEECVRLLIR